MNIEEAQQMASGLDKAHADELLKLENQMCFPLYACSKEVVRRYAPYLEPLGLTYTQYLVMMALWEHGALSVTRLGDLLYLDSGTLTPLLKKMEAKGYLTRTRSTVDERRVDVALTPEGEELKERAYAVPIAMGSCVDISAEEAAQLVALLRKVLGSVTR